MLPPILTDPLTDDVLAALRARLAEVGYTVDGITEQLGERAYAALQRNETTPGLLAGPGGAAGTLAQLWLMQRPVSHTDAGEALGTLLAPLIEAGIVADEGDRVRALVDLRPYAASEGEDTRDLWVLSDLTPGLDGIATTVAADHVLGISPASTSLVHQAVRSPVGSALDLGTGCGVQALHLAAHAQRVVATDVTARSLALAGLTARLNAVEIDLRDGGFFAPVAGERFDLVLTNPPFVISPPTDAADLLIYRDSGMPGDGAVERIVREVSAYLNPGGWCQVLANWELPSDRAWEERIASWIEDTGLSAWVVQREVLDPAQYVELWLKDSGHHPSTGGDVADYERRYAAWLAWLDQRGVAGVGFGWINLRRPAGGEPVVRRIEQWHHDVEQPIGPEVEAWHGRATWLAAATDADLRAAHLVRREDVVQETHGAPGAGDPSTIVLRQQRAMRRARTVDTVLAGLVGACDGELSVDQVLAALAHLLERDVEGVLAAYLPQVRELVEEGYLEPSGGDLHGEALP